MVWVQSLPASVAHEHGSQIRTSKERVHKHRKHGNMDEQKSGQAKQAETAQAKAQNAGCVRAQGKGAGHADGEQCPPLLKGE